MKPTINALVNVYKNISMCNYCGALKSSKDECKGFSNCSYLQKKFSKICVVETIADQWSIESTNVFSGYFHILGGTISGSAKYLKEMNPSIKVWGVDTYGSVFKKYHETGEFDKNEIYPYLTEGIGEDILPENVDFKIIDHFEKVTDENAAVFARRLAKKEGILAGYSCGAAIAGLHQLKSNFKKNENVVVLLHDSGTRYIAVSYTHLTLPTSDLV